MGYLSEENGQLCGNRVIGSYRTPEGNIVGVGRELDCLYLPTDVEVIYSPVEISDRWVGGIIRSKNVYGLFDFIEGVDVLNREYGQGLVVSRVEQSEAHPGPQSEGVDL